MLSLKTSIRSIQAPGAKLMIASGGRQFDHPCHKCLHANLGWHIQRPPKQSIFAASTADGSH